ncbi:MAG: putative toxin-antitoxin system toxin component, PIN family [Paracoccaceae bacterium]
MPFRAIFDTNVYVGAGFNPNSASATLIDAARAARITLVWDAPTREETRQILTKIPRLSWDAVEDIFAPEEEWTGGIDLAAVSYVEDPEDRKFAALSIASGATLISSDSDLLDHADRLNVMNPGAYLSVLNEQS